MPFDVIHVLEYAASSGIDPNWVFGTFAILCILQSKKMSKNATSIIDAVARVVGAWGRRRK